MKPQVQINTVLGEVEKAFPNYHVCILDDPEDSCVKYVRIFGVPADRVLDFKNKTWEIIESLDPDLPDFSFVPSIVTEEVTKKFYPDKMPDTKLLDTINRRFFICDCEDIQHQLCIEYIPGFGEIALRVLLTKSGSFWHRLKVAWNYLFGYPCTFGMFDEIDLDKPRIRSLINYLQEVEDIQYNKEKEYDKG